MDKVLDYIKNKRVLAGIGIGCLVVGTMVPYISMNYYLGSISVSLWRYWEGKVILTLAIIHLLFLFKDYIKKYVPQLFKNSFADKIMELNNPKLSLIPSALTIILLVKTHFELFDSAYAKELIKYGFGFYLIILGIICLVAHCFVYKGTANVLNDNAQGGANNMNMQPNGMNNVNQMNNMNMQPNGMNNVNQMNNMNMQPNGMNNVNQMNNMNMQPNGMDANQMNMQNGINNVNQTNNMDNFNNQNN